MEVLNRFDADVAWKVGRIMQKYRPIAPKPATSGSPPPAAGSLEASGRGKRRSPGGTRGVTRRGRKSKKLAESEGSVVTLPLMPETPERKEEPAPATHVPVTCFQGEAGPAVVTAPKAVRAVGSWATVEEVTDTWRSGEPGLAGDERAVRGALERDTCPGFVSDELDRVTWANAAYRKMVLAGPTEEEEEEEEVRVALVTRGKVPAGVTCFTCRVRLRYACRGRGRVSMAAPCDVWRLADGKLVWRLDVKAALSLGLSG